jgi:hypothetical protein
MEIRSLSLVLILVLLAQTVLADDVYHTYYNSRFGYSIAYPKNILYPQGESENGDGQKFLSKDADASLIVYGSNNVLNESLEDLYFKESRGGMDENPKKIVTYKVLKNNWFVVSGYNSGKVFYQKTILYKDQFISFHFEYPESKKNIFDPITKHIASSFKVQLLDRTTDTIERQCNKGSEALFAGGWIVGAGGNGFIDPVKTLEDVLEAPFKEKEIIWNRFPLVVRWDKYGRAGCHGVSFLDSQTVFVSEPLGGGKIRGGKFSVVAARITTEGGRTAACLIVVPTQDLICK